MAQVTTPVITDATGRLIASAIAASSIVPTEVTIADDGDVTQELMANTAYHFTGNLTSLTITLAVSADSSLYNFDFISGTTAPTLTLPNTVSMPSTFTVDANKYYEINILNKHGVVISWANF